MSKNNQSRNSDIDIISPLSEALCHFLELFGEIVVYFLKWLIPVIKRKYFGIETLTPIEAKHLKNKKQSNSDEFLGYSTNNKHHYPLNEINMGKHTAIIGSTGSGKSVCLQLLIDHALKKGKPVIYFDPKASTESINTFKKMCSAQGKKLYLFSDICTEATTFNPLLEGELEDITDRIMNALEWSEPFYKNESIQALDQVLELLKETRTPITFKNIVIELEKHANKKNIKGLINQL